jgi:SAM-dependent methyltransferase
MSAVPQTYDLSLLDRSLGKWNTSPALRAVYADIFAEMRRELVAGTVLEVGSGIGMARDYFPGLVTSDIVRTRFVDRAISAYDIPREGWGNVVAIDMLHHLQEPLRFLESAAASLAPGGRVVLAEPAGTVWGRRFYRWFHHEPCGPHAVQPPFRFAAAPDGAFANMGMAHVLFGRERRRVAAGLQQHGLRILSVRYRDFLAYPATGGFSRRALLPAAVLRGIIAVEHRLPQALLRFLALRMIVVLEKTGAV